MSKQLELVLISAGIQELLKGPEMQSVLAEKATEIRNRCGDGYEQDIHIGRSRANAMVWPETLKAKSDNKKHNTILKAVK